MMPSSSSEKDFSLLCEVLAKFACIPYENLSKIIKFAKESGKDPANILRKPSEVFEDHEKYGLGGTCFSLTYALKSLLDPLHIRTDYVLADMKWGRRVHCALVVRIGGDEYLIDPGYLFSEPLALRHTEKRVISQKFVFASVQYREGQWNLYTFSPALQPKWRYRFSPDPVTENEFFFHWRESFFQKSMNHLCISRVSGEAQAFFARDFMRVTTPSSKKNINVKRDADKTIEEYFGIHPQMYQNAREALNTLKGEKREPSAG